jgi:signal transduction histidine kinase
MKKIKLQLVFLLLSGYLFAQNTEIDSLKRLLDTAKENYWHVMNLEALSYAYLSSHPDTSLQYAQEGLALARKINSRSGEASCIIAIGSVYFHFGDYPRALETYLQALRIKEKLGHENLAVILFNIADVYITQEDFAHALVYLHKAMENDQQRKDTSGVLFDLYTLGATYNRMKKPDSSLYYTNKALEFSKQAGDQSLLGSILNNYAATYEFQEKYPLALKYYHASIDASLSIGDNEVLAEDYFGLAKVYKLMQRTDSSIFYASKSLDLAQAAPFLNQVLDASKLLSEAYAGEKKFDSAYKYFKLSTETKDSLFNVEQVKKLETLKYNEQQRQQAVETAKREYKQKLQLYAVIAASVIFLVLAIVLWRNNKQKQRAYILLQQQKQKTDEALSELQATQIQLVHAEKMASLGELTAGIAHEIENPLNFVNNFSDINLELAEEAEEALGQNDREEAEAILREIKQNLIKVGHHGMRADAIVKNMLQHSGRSTGRKELTHLNTLIDGCLRSCYLSMQAKQHSFSAILETHYDPSIGNVIVVPQDLKRVLQNLFDNAFYALHEKKKQQPENYEPLLQVTTKKVDGKVEIAVKDNGTGIPETELDKVFQPFFTTKPTGEGTGLGLSLSYDIITKGHGGELKVETKNGEGATFIIHLPQHPEKSGSTINV